MTLLFLFASIGVLNGLIAVFYLVVKRQRTVSDIYFAGLVLMLCVRIGKSILLYFFSEVDLLILQLGLSACIFIGPFFYLYLRSLRKVQQSFARIDLIQLTLLLVAIISVGVIYPYNRYPEYWNPEIVQGIYVIWGVYFLLGIREAYLLIGLNHKTLRDNHKYLIIIVLGVSLITISYQLALYVGFTYIWGAFIFSFFFYLIGLRALFKFKTIVPQSKPRKLDDGEEIFQKINSLMKNEKLYINQNLKLEDIAKKLGVNRHAVSQVMNEVYGLGYAHYIKSHRIAEAQVLIKTRSELSLEGIGYEAGFKSKSVFFESFRKLVGCTPAAYKKQLKT